MDIGANIGYFSVLAARRVGKRGRVFAFEPSQRNCVLLQLSAVLNGLSNIDIYPFAVAEKETTVVFDLLLGSNGIISQELDIDLDHIDELAHKTLVRTVKLDSVLSEVRRIDVIKIDIEGAEYRALVGADELIRKHQPIILSEYSPGWLPEISGVSGRDYLLAVVKRGYAISILETDGHSADCGHNIGQVLDYCEERGVDHLDLIAYPSNARRRFPWFRPFQ